ncbi:MAG: hypothetical protein IJB86_05170 [Clostridia bacterium]|nr:hypothetical protein [Clostridia bacterium]
MAKKKKKKNKMPYYIATVTAIFAALSVCIALYSTTLNKKEPTAEETVTENTVEALSADSAVTTRNTYGGPMLTTDIDNVFLNIQSNGYFTFYENRGGALSAISDVQTVDVRAECSHQEIPATVHYIERNGVVTGYGLFTTSICSEDVRLFDYAFFRIANMPEGYGSDKHILMIDFDAADFALNDKTYSEAFGLDIASGKLTKLTSDNGRTIDRFGRFRSDWAQLNDALIDFSLDKLYLSGRNYLLDSTSADLIFIEGNTKTKPTWKSSGLYENYLNTLDGKLYYAKEAEGGFGIFSMTPDGTETRISAYSGSVNDYLFCGDYIFNKNNLVLKRISTDENKADLKAFKGSVAYPEFMSVSKDGTKLVVLFNTAPQSAVLFDLSTGTGRLITEEKLFTNTCSQIMWLSDNSFMTVSGNGMSEYETLVWSF